MNAIVVGVHLRLFVGTNMTGHSTPGFAPVSCEIETKDNYEILISAEVGLTESGKKVFINHSINGCTPNRWVELHLAGYFPNLDCFIIEEVKKNTIWSGTPHDKS